MKKMFVLMTVMMLMTMALGAFALDKVSLPYSTQVYTRTFSLGTTEAVVVTPGFTGQRVDITSTGKFCFDINEAAAGYATDSTEVYVNATTVLPYTYYSPGITSVGIKGADTSGKIVTVTIYSSSN